MRSHPGLGLVILLLLGCRNTETPMTRTQLTEFATRYTAAWCSHQPERVAEFFAEEGSLTINRGVPAVGRAAIATAVQGFLTAFPDLVVTMDSLQTTGPTVRYHWTLTGTNTGPGGTGRRVQISGYEEWTFGSDGRIAHSLGRFDEAAYRAQLQGTAESASTKRRAPGQGRSRLGRNRLRAGSTPMVGLLTLAPRTPHETLGRLRKRGVALGPDGAVYLGDITGARIQKFVSAGR